MNPKVLGAFASGVLASGAIFYFASRPSTPVVIPAVEKAAAKKAVEPPPEPAVQAPLGPVEKPAATSAEKPATTSFEKSPPPARGKSDSTPPVKRERWPIAAKSLAGSVITARAVSPNPVPTSEPVAKVQMVPEAPAVQAPENPVVTEAPKRGAMTPEAPKAENARREPIPLTPPSSGSSSSAPATGEPRKVTLSGGTLFTVRTAEPLSSSKQKSGDSFRATLDQPVIVEGLVIAERGSTIEGRVVDSGKTNGTSRLQLELIRFTSSDGQTVGIRTASYEQEGKGGGSTKTDTAKKVGIGAAAGAVLGGIIGGGKGAGIGAATGGAAGGGVVLATRGKPVEVPAETRMTFRLTDPVEITEKINR